MQKMKNFSTNISSITVPAKRCTEYLPVQLSQKNRRQKRKRNEILFFFISLQGRMKKQKIFAKGHSY